MRYFVEVSLPTVKKAWLPVWSAIARLSKLHRVDQIELRCFFLSI